MVRRLPVLRASGAGGARARATLLLAAALLSAAIAGPAMRPRPAAGSTEAPKRAPGLSLAYDVYYLAFRILSVESTTVVERDAYRTDSFMRTVGFLGTLFPWESRSSAFGAIAGANLVPGAYRLRSQFRGRPIEVDLHYAAGGQVVE